MKKAPTTMSERKQIPSKTLFIDTETTGRHPPRDTLVEIAIIDSEGNTVLDSLVNPQRPVGDAKVYHGITGDMLGQAPTLRQLWPKIEAIVFGCHVVAWNLEHEIKYLKLLPKAAGHMSCAMKRFAPIYGEYSAFHNDYTFKSLKDAMDYTSCRWDGPPHRALSDALACRSVWQWMETKATFNEPPILMLPLAAS